MEISTHGTNEINSRFVTYEREFPARNNGGGKRKESKKMNQNLI